MRGCRATCTQVVGFRIAFMQVCWCVQETGANLFLIHTLGVNRLSFARTSKSSISPAQSGASLPVLGFCLMGGERKKADRRGAWRGGRGCWHLQGGAANRCRGDTSTCVFASREERQRASGDGKAQSHNCIHLLYLPLCSHPMKSVFVTLVTANLSHSLARP